MVCWVSLCCKPLAGAVVWCKSTACIGWHLASGALCTQQRLRLLCFTLLRRQYSSCMTAKRSRRRGPVCWAQSSACLAAVRLWSASLPACCATQWPAGLEQSLLPLALLMLAVLSAAASLISPPSVCLPLCLLLPPSAMQLATQISRRQPPLHASCTRRSGKACPAFSCVACVPLARVQIRVIHLLFALPSAARRGPLPLPAHQTSLRL